jgi:uncharacterized membrane protein (DUF2068 family)
MDSRTRAPRDTWITLIGVGKLLKATALVAFSLVAERLLDPARAQAFRQFVDLAGLVPGGRLVHTWLAKLASLDPRKLAELGVVTVVYAALFAVEGVGLLLQKRWAEYVTIGITGSFIPLEVYELVAHASPGKAIGLALNVAAVAYLVWHLRRNARR